MGIPIKPNNQYSNPWKDWEINILRNNFNNGSYKYLSSLLDRSFDSIRTKCYSLNLKKKLPPRWSEEEIKILKENYYNKNNEELSKLLLNRKKSSINAKLCNLGLKRDEKFRIDMIRQVGFNNKNKKRSKENRRKQSETRKRLIKEGKIKIDLSKLQSKESREKRGKSFKKTLRENPQIKINAGKKLAKFYKEHPEKTRLGFKHSEETKNIIKKARAKQIFPLKDSSIEVKIRNFLDELKIEYLQHKHINIKHGYQCDFFIPSLYLVVETDGNYWHKYPVGRDIDKIRTSELISEGFKVLRLWESEINNMNLNKFRGRLDVFQ